MEIDPNKLNKFLYESIEYRRILSNFPKNKTAYDLLILDEIARTLYLLTERLKNCLNCKFNTYKCIKDHEECTGKHLLWQPRN